MGKTAYHVVQKETFSPHTHYDYGDDSGGASMASYSSVSFGPVAPETMKHYSSFGVASRQGASTSSFAHTAPPPVAAYDAIRHAAGETGAQLPRPIVETGGRDGYPERSFYDSQAPPPHALPLSNLAAFPVRPNQPPPARPSEPPAHQRFGASRPYASASDGLPTTWGPFGRSSPYPSSPLTPPTVTASSNYGHRESGVSSGALPVPSPPLSACTTSSGRENTRPDHSADMSFSQRPSAYGQSYYDSQGIIQRQLPSPPERFAGGGSSSPPQGAAVHPATARPAISSLLASPTQPSHPTLPPPVGFYSESGGQTNTPPSSIPEQNSSNYYPNNARNYSTWQPQPAQLPHPSQPSQPAQPSQPSQPSPPPYQPHHYGHPESLYPNTRPDYAGTGNGGYQAPPSRPPSYGSTGLANLSSDPMARYTDGQEYRASLPMAWSAYADGDRGAVDGRNNGVSAQELPAAPMSTSSQTQSCNTPGSGAKESPDSLRTSPHQQPAKKLCTSTRSGKRKEENLGPRSPNAASRRSRGPFSAVQRQETSKTREMGACLRCKSQKIRCTPSSDINDTCETCLKVPPHSKKVLHDLRCIRFKVNEIVLYRNGGLGLTRRPIDTEVHQWATWVPGTETQSIEMKLFYSSRKHRYDLCETPLRIRVREFIPEHGDVLERKWTKMVVNADGTQTPEKRSVTLPPYALVDSNETVAAMQQYIEENTLSALAHVAQHSHPEVCKHYKAAIDHYHSFPDGDVEKKYLYDFFKLWFCVRYTTGSAYISGSNKLGCSPIKDPDYPLGDRISLPRMITAQFDVLTVKHFLTPLTEVVFPQMETLFRTGNPDHWFTVYICTFMLLHEIAFSCEDRRRHAVENSVTTTKYTVGNFVKELQFGGTIALCYWHYYKTMDPTDSGWSFFCTIINHVDLPRKSIQSAKGKGKKKVHVTAEQKKLVTEVWDFMADKAKKMNVPEKAKFYEHPLYFVSQMYEKKWEIRETYDLPNLPRSGELGRHSDMSSEGSS